MNKSTGGKFVFLVCLFVFVLLFYQNFSLKNTVQYQNKKVLEKKYLTSCLNQITHENEISVWTLLTDNSNYAKSAVKLLKSIELNSKFIKFDKFILELKEKQLKPEIKAFIVNNSNWKICQVDKIPPRDEPNTFPRFRDQFTKLILWNMTEFRSVVYFDSDTFVINNIEPLLVIYKKFNDSHKIAVTQDIRNGKWVDTFNMGIFQSNQIKLNLID